MSPPKKRSSTPPVSGVDHIGTLPDSILHHLLSFLPAQAAVRTCVLARRWRHLWRSTTGLRIVGLDDKEKYNVQDLRKFMDHLLVLREHTDLNTVEIKFDGFSGEDQSYVNLWTHFAVMHKVQVLSLHICYYKYLYLDNLPLVSQHLRSLDLYGVHLEAAFLDFANCPALENLKMNECGISAGKFIFTRDLKHCPTFSKLKTLLLNEYWCVAPDLDPLVCILKNSPVLEKLTLQLFSEGPNHEVEIKGRYIPLEPEGPSAISKRLNIVEIKCNVVDKRILKVLKFLSALNICFSF